MGKVNGRQLIPSHASSCAQRNWSTRPGAACPLTVEVPNAKMEAATREAVVYISGCVKAFKCSGKISTEMEQKKIKNYVSRYDIDFFHSIIIV